MRAAWPADKQIQEKGKIMNTLVIVLIAAVCLIAAYAL